MKYESLSPSDESTSSSFESLSPDHGATSPIQKSVSLIERSARELLKIYYYQPNIPSRMGEIVLALRDRKKLLVAQMRQITGVS
jgi:hypothetical protein